MGFYSHWLLLRLLEFSMRQERLLPYRQRTITSSRHVVLEVGVGTGLNLPFYRDVDCVYAIDPSTEFLEYSKQRTKKACPRVFLARASAEALPFKAGSFDTVVMTWTLCTIPDPLKALQEMRRVLKPQGWLRFVEHGLAPDREIEWWQDTLTPLWRRVSGGCHLNRKPDELIRTEGFRIEELHIGYMEGPKRTTYMYEGQARSA